MYLEHVTVVVDDYDRAIEFFVDVLSFELVEDSAGQTGDRQTGDGQTGDERLKRWVVVRPPGGETSVLLARADGPEQVAVLGRQTGGRVGFFLRVDDFDEIYERIAAAGVRIVRPPRSERYGKVAVFLDCMGNRWDLLGPRPKEDGAEPRDGTGSSEAK
jgi:catechol 2,3-dioxygenase-like lactoylglutathione lyase family enzyme